LLRHNEYATAPIQIHQTIETVRHYALPQLNNCTNIMLMSYHWTSQVNNMV